MRGLIATLILLASLQTAAAQIASIDQKQVIGAPSKCALCVAKVISASGTALVDHKPAKPGDIIHLVDMLETGPDGKMAIMLADETTVVMEPNSRMSISEFVYKPGRSRNAALMRFFDGTMTLLSGNIPKNGGQVRAKTPVGTLGIRGTVAHVKIFLDGSVQFNTLIEARKPPLQQGR